MFVRFGSRELNLATVRAIHEPRRTINGYESRIEFVDGAETFVPNSPSAPLVLERGTIPAPPGYQKIFIEQDEAGAPRFICRPVVAFRDYGEGRDLEPVSVVAGGHALLQPDGSVVIPNSSCFASFEDFVARTRAAWDGSAGQLSAAE